MKETRLAFSGEMILALLAGRKTETRRIINPQPMFDTDHEWIWGKPGQHPQRGYDLVSLANVLAVHCPYGQPGDIILPTETWRIGAWKCSTRSVAIDYKADGYCRTKWLHVADWDRFQHYVDQSMLDCSRAGMTYENANGFKWEPGQSPCRWRPARFMPKEFSRPELRRVLDSMKAERLQDITEEDAIAEGIDDATLWDHFAREYEDRPVAYLRRSMFVSLWQSINAKAYPWASNPWVWALTFEVVTQ